MIDNSPSTVAAVTITGSGGAVDGFEIRSAHQPLSIAGVAIVTGNDFPTTTTPTNNYDLSVAAVTGNVTIAGNEFSDDGAGANHTGIFMTPTVATNLLIEGNTFSGLQAAIFQQSGNGSPMIAGNTITGLHDFGHGVVVYQGSPVISENTIDSGVGNNNGISVFDTNGPVGATLSRNTISGLTNGLVVADTSLPVTMDGDVIAGNGFTGLQMSLGGDVTATNVTMFDNIDADIRVQDSVLTLDSSIVDDVARIGTATCAISFSRGFTVPPPGGDPTNCDDFQSAADPMFVGGGDYHLLAGSPMIDAGNPAAPGAGALDIDGDPRALTHRPRLHAPPRHRRRRAGAVPDDHSDLPDHDPDPRGDGDEEVQEGKETEDRQGQEEVREAKA